MFFIQICMNIIYLTNSNIVKIPEKFLPGIVPVLIRLNTGVGGSTSNIDKITNFKSKTINEATIVSSRFSLLIW